MGYLQLAPGLTGTVSLGKFIKNLFYGSDLYDGSLYDSLPDIRVLDSVTATHASIRSDWYRHDLQKPMFAVIRLGGQGLKYDDVKGLTGHVETLRLGTGRSDHVGTISGQDLDAKWLSKAIITWISRNEGPEYLINSLGADVDYVRGTSKADHAMIDGYTPNFNIYSMGGGNDRITLSSAGTELRGVSRMDGLSLVGGAGFDTLVLDVEGGCTLDLGAMTLELSNRLIHFKRLEFEKIDPGEGTRVIGTAGDDLYSGFGYISSAGGNDTINGTGKSDFLEGGDGNDRLYGLTGDDKLRGSLGDDFIYGGKGLDTLWFTQEIGPVEVNLVTGRVTGGTGNDTIVSIENVWATDFDDILTGNAKANKLSGYGRNDIIRGAGGADSLLGGWGDDFLYGGSGNDLLQDDYGNDAFYGGWGEDIMEAYVGHDTMAGGLGKDRFVIANNNSERSVLLQDFDAAVDVLELGFNLYGFESGFDVLKAYLVFADGKQGLDFGNCEVWFATLQSKSALVAAIDGGFLYDQ